MPRSVPLMKLDAEEVDVEIAEAIEAHGYNEKQAKLYRDAYLGVPGCAFRKLYEQSQKEKADAITRSQG